MFLFLLFLIGVSLHKLRYATYTYKCTINNEHKDKTILMRYICKISFLPFRTRLASKFAKIGNMTPKIFFPQSFNMVGTKKIKISC
jgi:hypothetical protein